MFDAHTHLQDPRLRGVLDEVIRNAAQAGVTGLCCCGTTPDDWEATRRLASAPLPFVVVPAFGVHPWYVRHLPEQWFETLELYLDNNPVAVIGEIGLDGILDNVPIEVQEKYFVRQLELAVRVRREKVAGQPVLASRLELLDYLYTKFASVGRDLTEADDGRFNVTRAEADRHTFRCPPSATSRTTSRRTNDHP